MAWGWARTSGSGQGCGRAAALSWGITGAGTDGPRLRWNGVLSHGQGWGQTPGVRAVRVLSGAWQGETVRKVRVKGKCFHAYQFQLLVVYEMYVWTVLTWSLSGASGWKILLGGVLCPSQWGLFFLIPGGVRRNVDGFPWHGDPQVPAVHQAKPPRVKYGPSECNSDLGHSMYTKTLAVINNSKHHALILSSQDFKDILWCCCEEKKWFWQEMDFCVSSPPPLPIFFPCSSCCCQAVFVAMVVFCVPEFDIHSRRVTWLSGCAT